MDDKATREQARAHIHPKLRRNLRLFIVIALALLIVVTVDTIRGHAPVWQVVLGFVAGGTLGMIFARMYKLSWDKNAMHVSSRIDIYGAVMLVLYIAFDLSRTYLVHIFTHSTAVPAISLALLAGAMYGRVLGSGHVIVAILREQQVIPARRSAKQQE
jgi:hypothetical protein